MNYRNDNNTANGSDFRDMQTNEHEQQQQGNMSSGDKLIGTFISCDLVLDVDQMGNNVENALDDGDDLDTFVKNNATEQINPNFEGEPPSVAVPLSPSSQNLEILGTGGCFTANTFSTLANLVEDTGSGEISDNLPFVHAALVESTPAVTYVRQA